MVIEIKKLNSTDVSEFIALIEILNEVFENSDEIPGPNYLSEILNQAHFSVFVVLVDELVVGGLTMYVLKQYYKPKPQAYIYDVGISPEFQNKGLGKSLMQYVLDYCGNCGIEQAWVEAEQEDTDAIAFYRKTYPNNEMLANHFTYITEKA